jgi:ATP-binding cassette subfamily F protein 3
VFCLYQRHHINFRHLPVIAKAVEAYKGGLILVSHSPEFVSQIKFDETRRKTFAVC